MLGKYYVWCKERDKPRRRHDQRASAEIEAERLAKTFPEHTFWVVKAISYSKARTVITTRVEEELF